MTKFKSVGQPTQLTTNWPMTVIKRECDCPFELKFSHRSILHSRKSCSVTARFQTLSRLTVIQAYATEDLRHWQLQ